MRRPQAQTPGNAKTDQQVSVEQEVLEGRVPMIAKHPALEHVLARLRDDLGPHYFRLVDYWDSDSVAQGIENAAGSRSVYVALKLAPGDGGTLSPTEGLYYYECERGSADEGVTPAGVAPDQGVTYDELLDVVREYLGG